LCGGIGDGVQFSTGGEGEEECEEVNGSFHIVCATENSGGWQSKSEVVISFER
jgi:hypothetical protein